MARKYIRKPPRFPRNEPHDFAWVMACYKAAQESSVRPADVLGGSTSRKNKAAVLARWRAWRMVLDTFPHVSIAGLGRVSGFDHSTIIRAMKILDHTSETAGVR